MKKINLFLILISFTLVYPLTCWQNEAYASQKKPFDQELVVTTATVPADNSLPHMGQAMEMAMYQNMYEFLVFRNPKTGQPSIPGLAERWEVTDNSQKYTFYLRKGIPWQNGWGEFTAEDVKFTFGLAMRKESVNTNAKGWTKLIKRIEIENPYKINFYLNKPDWQFIETVTNYLPWLPITCKKYIEKVGEKEANLKPIGTGPYKFIDRRAGDYIKFEAVENHWRKTPDFKWITVKSVPEISTRIAMLRNGEADIIPIPADRVKEIRKLGFNIVANPGGRIYWVCLPGTLLPNHEEFDSSLPWWADPANTKEWNRALKVRKAMNLAVNKKELNDVFFLGTGTIFGVGCFGWPGQPGHDIKTFPPYLYNPEKAKKLLKEAGYPNGFEISISIMKHGGRPEAPDLAEAVSIYWENIGIKVKRVRMDYGTFRKAMMKRKHKTAWVYGSGWYAEPIVPAWRLSNYKRPFNTGADHEYTNDIAERAAVEVDSEKRLKLTRQWGEFAHTNYLTVPLIGKPSIWALSKRVGKDWPVILGDGYDFQQLEHAAYNQ
jgi:peptide/nickel transport system substrate-binding protein